MATPPEKPKKREWQTLEYRDAFEVPGRFKISVEKVALPDGRIVDDYWQIIAGEYVVVFAQTVSGESICLHEYRHGARRVGTSLVAGQIENGETPLAAAQRELLEETGYTAPHWRELGRYVISSSQGAGHVHFLHATDARAVQSPDSQDLEAADVMLLKYEELIAALRSMDFLTADHVAAIGLALLTDTKRLTE